MNRCTITYYDIINDCIATYTFDVENFIASLHRKFGVEVLSNIIKPIFFEIEGIEVTDNSVNILSNTTENVIDFKNTIEKVKLEPFVEDDGDTQKELDDEQLIVDSFVINFSKYENIKRVTLIKRIETEEEGVIFDICNNSISLYAKWAFKSIARAYHRFLKHREQSENYYKIMIYYSRYSTDNILNRRFNNIIELQDFIINKANYKKDNIYLKNSIQYKDFYNNEKYNIHQISRIDDNGDECNTIEILYSDGICTNDLKNVSYEMKKWFKNFNARITDLDNEANKHFTNLFSE